MPRAAWLSRSDLEQQTQISIFVTQSIDMLEQFSHIVRASNSANMFHVLGVLQTTRHNFETIIHTTRNVITTYGARIGSNTTSI
jgi:hypothetical protein